MLNSVNLQGNLTRDPEIQNSSNGNPFCRFGIAWNPAPRNGEKQPASFYDCVAFGKTAEMIGNHFEKGKSIIIEGRLEQNRVDDGEGNKRVFTNIVVNSFHFAGDGKQSERDSSSEPRGNVDSSSNVRSEVFDDDVPF